MSQTVATLKENPFPGLRPFKEDEEYLFFGRENQVDSMVNKLAGTHFLTVVGSSGSGKSSLVNCGLRPALLGGFMSGVGSAWRIAQFRPGSDPIEAMALALAENGALFCDYKEEGLALGEIISTTLRMGKRGLIDIYEQARMDTDTSLLVVVDQFEELFRYQQLEVSQTRTIEDINADASAFVNLLLEVKRETYPIYVVLTMRSDFLGDCAQFPGLAEAINAGQYLIPRMTRSELRAAIQGPVGVGGAEISPVLLTRLVNDVGDNPDQLSILQHALNRTWTRWQNEGGGHGPLELTHYEGIGTMEYALDQHAEKAYGELNCDQQRICEKLFKVLTDKATDPRGVRRPTKLDELCDLTDAAAAEVTAVIDVFRKPSRSFLMPPSLEKLEMETVIDISHESLMRVWKRLEEWVEQEVKSAQTYLRIADTAALYKLEEASLLRDPELATVLDWREKNQPNGAWARQYGASWEDVEKFIDDSVVAHTAEIAEQEKARQLELDRRIRDAENAEKELALQREFKLLRRSKAAIFALFLGLLVALAFGFYQMRIAQEKKEVNELMSEVLETRLLFHSNLQLEALLSGIKIGKKVRGRPNQGIDIALMQILQRVVYNIQEYNRLERHDEWIRCVSYSPDGQFLATGSNDKTVNLWTQDGQFLVTLQGHTSSVNSVSFSPDSKILATGSADGTVKLWNLDGTLLRTVESTTVEASKSGENSNLSVNAVRFSPDGKTLAIGRHDSLVELRSLDGKLLKTFPGHSGPVNAVSFSLDGQTLATGSADSTVKLWNLDGGLQHSFDGHDDTVRSISFSPDGKTLATGSDDQTIKLWSLDGAMLETLEGHTNFVRSVSFSPDGKTLASGSFDDTVRLWGIEWDEDKKTQTKILKTYGGHSGPVLSVAFSPDNKTLATGGADATVRLLKISNLPIPTLDEHTDSILSINFSPDGQTLATGSRDSTVKLWRRDGQNLKTFSLERTIPFTRYAKDRNKSVWIARFSPDGEILAVGSPDYTVKLFKSLDGQLLRILKGHREPVRSISFSRDGKTLATGSEDKTIKVWDLDDGELLGTFVESGPVLSVDFSPDGKTLATGTGGDGPNVKLWSINNGRLRKTLREHKGPVRSLAFSPDGRTLATGSDDQKVRLWRLDGSLRATLKGHSGPVHSISFHPSGKTLATGSEDQTVNLWNLKGQPLGSISSKRYATNGHNLAVTSVSFSPDGETLATGSHDQTIKLWDFDLEDLLDQGCDWLSDYLKTHPEALKSGESDFDYRFNLGESCT